MWKKEDKIKAKKKYLEKVVNRQKHYISINDNLINLKVTLISSLKSKYQHLVLQKNLDLNQGYYYVNKKAINSFGIKFHLDIVFCSKHHEVINLIENFSNQSITPYINNSYYIFCFTSGAIKFFNIKLTDIIKIEKF